MATSGPSTVALPDALQWLYGDLFLRRIEFERNHREVLWSQMIRKFYGRPDPANYWAGLICDYRNALVNPDEAPRKLADELKVDCPDFDAALFDSYAEIGAVPKLRTLGFDSFEVLVRPGGSRSRKTADLKARRNGEPAALEVKNLRAHECVETYLPKLFEDLRLKGQDMSGLRLVVQRSSRDTLDEQQKQALRKIVEAIRDYPRNENISVELSERTTARSRVVDGSGDAMCSDGILLSELIGSVSDFDGLFRKIVTDLQGGKATPFTSCFRCQSPGGGDAVGHPMVQNNGTRKSSAGGRRDRAARTRRTIEPNRFACLQ